MNDFKFLTLDELRRNEPVLGVNQQPTAADDLRPTPHCHACGVQITALGKSAVVFLNIVPYQPEHTASHLYCFDCNPDRGYCIGLDRLVADGCFRTSKGWGWVNQLREKGWCPERHVMALVEVCEWARTLEPCAPRTARRRPRRQPTQRPRTPPGKRQRARILERDAFACKRCGAKPVDGVRLVVDHIVPVALGGSSDDGNLQTLCEPCNQGKAARPPHPSEVRCSSTSTSIV